MLTLPILYSLRNCPFAIRARLAIYKSKQCVELRDVVLNDKPPQMLSASPKGTVPTLVLTSSQVIDESLEVMLWALKESDPDDLLRNLYAEQTPQEVNKQADERFKHSSSNNSSKNVDHPLGEIHQPFSQVSLIEILDLIHQFDEKFKTRLEQYKCAKRYHESNLIQCRQACEIYIKDLELRLSKHDYLMDENESLADIAVLPFIRQFARVERQWYLQSPYPNVKRWLNRYLQSAMFTKVMAKHPVWKYNDQVIVFPRQR